MALSRITDITRQIDHQIQNIFDEVESVLAPGGGTGLGDPGSNGIVVRTALGVTTARSLAAPAAGLTIANNDGVSGNPTFALANDLLALEGLSGTGFSARTAADTWAQRTLTGTVNQISIANGDGVSGNPTISIPANSQLSIAKITNLTGNGFIKTSGSDGSLSIDTSTYATVAYADSLVVGLLDDRGNYDASVNTFPASGGSGSAGAILKGDLWTVSVAGTLGGQAVTAGDLVRALVDTPGQTSTNWAISETNIGYVPLNSALADGKIYIGNASGIGTAVTPSGDVTISNAGVTAIGAAKVTNAMLAGSIAAAKLSLNDGQIFVGNGSNVAAGVTPSGDVTITNLGVTAIGNLKVTNAMLAGSINPNKLLVNTDFLFTANQSISNTAPSISLVDTTASAKSLTVAVDGNFADLREFAGAAGSLLRLDLANNRVGIGTTGPGALLHVSTSQNASTIVKVSNVNTGTAAMAQFQLETSVGNPTGQLFGTGGSFTTDGGYVQDSVGLFSLGAGGLSLAARNAAGVIRFYTSSYSAERMRIDNVGNVGIGSVAPNTLLEIQGAPANAVYVYLSDTANITTGLTSLHPTEVFGMLGKGHGAIGGLIVRGLSDAGTQPALKLDGMIGDTTTSVAAVQLRAFKKSGTTIAPLAATELAFQVVNNATVLTTWNGGGNAGFNTITPRTRVDILDTAQAQMRLTYADNSVYADFTVGNGGNLTIAPTGDFIFNPVGNDILPNTGYDLNLGSLSQKYLTLHAAELWVETLVAQDTIATIGGRILVGPTTVLTSDITTGATTILVKHNEMAVGDRVYMEANGSVEFMAVTAGPTGTGPYSYTVTRNLDGSGANAWSAGDAVFNTGTTGDGFIDLYSVRGVKASSQAGPAIVGNVRNSATYNDWSEHWAIGNLNGLYGYGVTTYGAAFGEYAAGKTHVTIDSTNGYRTFSGLSTVVQQIDISGNIVVGQVAASQSNIQITSGAINLRTNTTVFGSLSSAGVLTLGEVGAAKANTLISAGALSIRLNTTALFNVDTSGNVLVGQTGAGQSNVYITAGAVNLRNNVTSLITLDTSGNALFGQTGASQSNVYISAGAVSVRNNTTAVFNVDTAGTVLVGQAAASQSNIQITSGAINLRTNTTVYGTLSSAGVLTLGEVGAGKSNTLISAGDFKIRLNTTSLFNIDTSGNVRTGIDTSAAATTRIFISNASQTYNSEAGFLAGDVLIGDNTAASNEGNIKITAAGQIAIRRGTTNYITLDATDAQFTNLIKMSGASAAITIGATPPTSATVGTGLWADRDGIVALTANVQQSTLTSAGITAGAGAVTLDANGLNLSSGTGTTNQIEWYDGAVVSGGLYSFNSGKASLFAEARGNTTITGARAVINATEKDGLIQATLDLTSPTGGTSDARIYGGSNGITGLAIGSNTAPTAMLDIVSDKLRLRTAKTPASAAATGSQGDICWDASFIYVCVGASQWKRAALSTW